jgi:hypothetical protein
LAIHGFGAEALLRNEPGLHLLATDAAASAMMTSRASARVAFATVELAARMIKAGLSPDGHFKFLHPWPLHHAECGMMKYMPSPGLCRTGLRGSINCCICR